MVFKYFYNNFFEMLAVVILYGDYSFGQGAKDIVNGNLIQFNDNATIIFYKYLFKKTLKYSCLLQKRFIFSIRKIKTVQLILNKMDKSLVNTVSPTILFATINPYFLSVYKEKIKLSGKDY